MKKVLFLTHQIPFPTVSGGLFKTYKLIECLNSKTDLSLIVTDPDASSSQEKAFLEKIKIKKFKRYPFRLTRGVWAYVKSIFFRTPMSVMRNYHPTIEEAVRVEALKADIIFVDHFLMFQYVPASFKGTVILHQHNAEYVMWQKYSEVLKNLILKILVQFESQRVACYEKKICQRASWILCSPNDKQKLVQIGVDPLKIKETLHLGDMELLNEAISNFESLDNNILFIGTLSWEANLNGLKWFLADIWPKIKSQKSDVRLDIIGKCPEDPFLEEFRKDPQISWHGFVDELAPFYSKAKVFIAPLLFGSGIKVKVVNALYRGVPTVTTSIGIEGMELINGKHIHWADEPGLNAKAILELLQNKEKWEILAREGREFSEQHLNWDKALSCLDEIL